MWNLVDKGILPECLSLYLISRLSPLILRQNPARIYNGLPSSEHKDIYKIYVPGNYGSEAAREGTTQPNCHWYQLVGPGIVDRCIAAKQLGFSRTNWTSSQEWSQWVLPWGKNKKRVILSKLLLHFIDLYVGIAVFQ